MYSTIIVSLAVALALLVVYAVYHVFILPRFNPLRNLCGPPVHGGLFGNHMSAVLDPFRSPKSHEKYVKHYGRSIRIRGLGPWDDRLLTLDPVSLAHVLKNSTIYEKPWQSRRLITGLIGCGMLAAEGDVHKRQRRVATPAFGVQNMRALVPLVWSKGNQLKERWLGVLKESGCSEEGVRLDVCHWISRATFDVIGLAGFDYHFNAIQDETNELFCAYKEMFEIAISQGQELRSILGIYFPLLNTLYPDKATITVSRCQKVIRRVAGQLVQEKKRKIMEGEKSGSAYAGKDLLSLLLKSNVAVDLPPSQRISDEDILHNINTFMFAGSDTTSLALTWTLLLLAEHPSLQTRLRDELLSIAPSSEIQLTPDEIESLHNTLAGLPFLHNVSRESLRLIPPVHSSLRVATQDDEVPTSYPVHIEKADGSVVVEEGRSISVPKGSFVHVPVEAFNLDKEMWGEDAWEFNPDRWDNLPEAALAQPGLFSNLLTFSAGPRSCIGMRFSMIEMKAFLYILLTNFTFAETGEKIIKANVVLTRPYLARRFKEGSQCPLLVKPYVRHE